MTLIVIASVLCVDFYIANASTVEKDNKKYIYIYILQMNYLTPYWNIAAITILLACVTRAAHLYHLYIHEKMY